MNGIKEQEWQCHECKYKMNGAVSPSDPTAKPTDGDLTLCMNCGHLYIRHDDKWVEPSVDEYLSFDQYIKEDVEAYRKVRAEVVKENLVKDTA